MILTKEVNLKINSMHFKHLKKFGYDNFKKNEIITIPVEHLPRTSSYEIDVKCDVCGKEKLITYHRYLLSFNKGGCFVCSCKCSTIKNVNTCLEKYGVKSMNRLDEIKNKIKETKLKKYGDSGYNNHLKYEDSCMKKYGVKNCFQNDIIKEKIKQKHLEQYGVENPSQSELIKERKIKTSMKNYGFDHPLKSDIVLNKIFKTNYEIYGTKSPMQNNDIKNKTKITNNEKYGKDSVLQVQEVKDKIKKTNLIRYGVEYPSQNTTIHDKMLKNSSIIRFYMDTDLYYQGSYELDFLNVFYDKVDIKNGMTIRYRSNKILS
jgi:hypothetical protein